MLPTTPTTIGNLLKKSMQHHISVFKKILPLILLMIVVKDLYIYLGGMPRSLLLQYVVGVVILILLIYFFVISLYLADHVIKSRPITFPQAFRRCISLTLQTYIAVFTYIVIFIALFYLSRFIIYLANIHVAQSQIVNSLISLLIFGLPFLFFAVLTFFAIPIIILDKTFPWFGFRQSIRLVGVKNWIQSLVGYVILMALALLVDPTTLHGYLLASYYLNAPFDFVVLSVILPFFNNLIIFSLNDLKLKQKEKTLLPE